MTIYIVNIKYYFYIQFICLKLSFLKILKMIRTFKNIIKIFKNILLMKLNEEKESKTFIKRCC